MELTHPAQICELLAVTRRIAVLGIKTSAQVDQPAFYVPQYLLEAGFDVMPVPVYYPEAIEILGRPVYRRLTEIPGEIDMVDIFRRGADIEKHLDDLLAAKPRSVWFQLGIRNERIAQALIQAGIAVVQDRCLMVEHKQCRARAKG